MLRPALTALFIAGSTLAVSAADGWIIKESPSSVSDTADKLVGAVEGAGATVFARVDHAAGAASIDAELPPMTLVMFGNPRIGTPIMQAAPAAGLDLPLRVLIWDQDGTTQVGYLDPAELKARYSVEGADETFAAMTGALDNLTNAATQ